MSLDRALELVLAHEGGWSDHPDDTGGRTMWGVTEGTLERARENMDGLPEDVADLTQDQARRLYRRLYWEDANCDLLPWPVSYALMDAAVQHGTHRARKWLQRGLGVHVDGIVGPQTRAAIEDVRDWWRPASRMLLWRAKFYIRILRRPSQASFAAGWANRMQDVIKIVEQDLPEEDDPG